MEANSLLRYYLLFFSISCSLAIIIPDVGAAIENMIPRAQGGVVERGKCSWYGAKGEIPPGHPTASGEGFNRFANRAAHKTLRFGTKIRVKNESNGRTVDVIINDRGPYCPATSHCPPEKVRIVDLTYGAMKQIANLDTGVIPCSYVII